MMTGSLLDRLPQEILRLLRLVGSYADQRRVSCYLIGGVVRDLLLGRDNLDIDIVVESDAVEFCKPLAQRYQTALTVYPRFKTATLTWDHRFVVDFSSTRKETYPTPGALPVVVEGTLKDDIFRRDFTINAMAISLNQDNYGTLVDMCRGQDDIRSRTIRVFHAKSFEDDPTRILRAIRFQERYQFQIAEETSEPLRQAVEGKFWKYVSAGRYFEEFKKILKEPSVLCCLDRLQDVGGFSFFSKEIVWTPAKKDHFKRVQTTLLWMQEQGIDRTALAVWLAYLMILISDQPIEKVQDIVNRLSLSRHDSRKIISCKLEQEIVKRLDMNCVKPSQVYNVLKSMSAEEILFFLVKTHGQPPEMCIQNFLTQYRNVHLCTRGEDLMRLGICDGKRIGATLQILLERKIDAGAMTKEQELSLLQEMDFI